MKLLYQHPDFKNSTGLRNIFGIGHNSYVEKIRLAFSTFEKSYFSYEVVYKQHWASARLIQ